MRIANVRFESLYKYELASKLEGSHFACPYKTSDERNEQTRTMA